MSTLRLPALDGRSPLGVLAAFGLLRLLDVHTDDTPRLSWSPEDLTAVLHTTRGSVDDVVGDLVGIIGALKDGALLPGLPAGFPPPGAAPDRLRVPQRELGSWARDHLDPMPPAAATEAAAWLGSLVTDLGADPSGRVAISQFTAPSGKQSMSTMLAKPLDQVRADHDLLRQALVAWRRYPGVTGEYLDHRAMWDATEAADGATGMMRGVPGATWLALMSYPMFRTTWSVRKRPLSSGWHTVTEGRRRYDELRLPIWTSPIGVAAVVALVEHPSLAPRKPRMRGQVVTDDGLGLTPAMRALGIVQLCRARRRQPPGSKSAGVLAPVS